MQLIAIARAENTMSGSDATAHFAKIGLIATVIEAGERSVASWKFEIC
jgi:hypothetical protein